MDSLTKAILMEPERFLSYIKKWGNIFTLKDFMKAIRKSFGFHYVGSNIYKSSEIQSALKLLWENKYTKYKVKKNYQRLKKKYKDVSTEDEFQKMRKKLFEDKYDIKKNIKVKTLTKEYEKSYRRWGDREEKWLRKNRNLKTSTLTDLFNAIFKPRTKKSISMKKRRLT